MALCATRSCASLSWAIKISTGRRQHKHLAQIRAVSMARRLNPPEIPRRLFAAATGYMKERTATDKVNTPIRN